MICLIVMSRVCYLLIFVCCFFLELFVNIIILRMIVVFLELYCVKKIRKYWKNIWLIGNWDGEKYIFCNFLFVLNFCVCFCDCVGLKWKKRDI